MRATRAASAIAADYRSSLEAKDAGKSVVLLQEEAALVLLTILANLSADPKSFIHRVALKGGALMLGELGSPRFSADLDFTRGHQAGGIELAEISDDLERGGRPYAVRSVDAQRNRYSIVVTMTYQSLCLGARQPSKVEISLREDPVVPLREASIDATRWGIAPFAVHALDPHDLVAEKIRTLFQRAQPRDLYDTWFYLTKSDFHLSPATLRGALDRKFQLTRLGRYRESAWRAHLEEIELTWEPTLLGVLHPDQIPDFSTVSSEVDAALRGLRIQ